MRRKRAIKRSHIVSLVIAGGVGFAVGGGYNTVALRTSTDLTAAQTVALRFPQELADAVDAGPMAAAKAAVMGSTQLALLSPQPMDPQTGVEQSSPPSIPQSSAPTLASAQTGAEPATTPAAAVPAGMQLASADDASLPRVTTAVPAPAQAIAAKPVAATAATTPVATATATATPAAPPRKRAERPGFVLNDAQIASIKQRLHLSYDQERMWPAVEAALRNLAYVRSRDAQRHGTPKNTAVASADPNSVEVQGLKSAAIPLLMSFNDEQKGEVRNLAHVMGLDQLASQF
jgi:hypothetical protein